MTFPILPRFMPVLAIITHLASPASADETTDGIKPLTSAFTGLGWSIGDVPLGEDFVTTMQTASPSTKLETRQWAAKRGTSRIQPVAPHDDYAGAGFNVTTTRGVQDRTVVEPTNWHTGNRVWLVSRTVQSNKPELMPTADDLIASVIEKYGPDPVTGRKNTAIGSMGHFPRGTLSYPVKDGQRHDGPCFDINKKVAALNASSSAEYEAARQRVSDITTGMMCEGVLVVSFANGRAGRLREYKITAHDFRMEAANIVHDYETKLRLLEEYEQNLPGVAPKL